MVSSVQHLMASQFGWEDLFFAQPCFAFFAVVTYEMTCGLAAFLIDSEEWHSWKA